MATELSSWKFRTNDRWEEKYNWKDWLNGKPWKLTRGTEEERLEGKADFSITAESFQQTALNYGRRHRKDGITRVSTEMMDEDTIIIQAFRATDPGIAVVPALDALHTAVAEIASAQDAVLTPRAAKQLRKDSEDLSRAVRKLVLRMPENI